MRVRLLGGLEIERVAERDLGSRKGRRLLKVLALARGQPVTADRLAEHLWGDDQPARPHDQVGVLVSRLRGVLGAERIIRSDAGYAFIVDWLDIDEVERLGASAAEALTDGRVGAARAAVGAALALTRGPLLPDEDGDWVEADRAAARASIRHARRVGVEAATIAGDFSAAAALAEQSLADDPYDEAVLRALMHAHLAAGRPASALAAYARTRHRLLDDLGVAPTAETQAVHALTLRAADDAAPPPLGETPSPDRGDDAGGRGIVGRGEELRQLDAALTSAAAGGVALVVVEGDPGIGKSTLVEAWARSVGARGVVLRGRCDELGRDLPLQPVADAVVDHLLAMGADRAAEIVGDDAAVVAPLFGSVTDVTATVVTDPEVARSRMFVALIDVLDRAGGPLPVVLVIEDLQLAGEGTRSWIAFCRRRARRVAIVMTTRPGGAKGIDSTHSVALGPLSRDAVADIVGDDRADELFARSAGHPLLLAALNAAPDTGAGALPATVADVVVASVDSLGQGVGATLRIAAALGADCDVDLIAQVAKAPAMAVLAELEDAALAGLIVERGGGFAFRHELVREVLESAMSSPRRALVHREAARALAARPGADALAVAVHARAGGDAALASASFVAAADAAVARFDVEAAEGNLAAAIDLAPTPQAYAARARVRMSRLDLESAALDAEQAVALGGGAPALEVSGWVAYYRRRYDEARAFADEAAARAEDDSVRISALALAGRVRHGSGDLRGAVERLASVTDGPPAVRGIADVWLAFVRVHEGRPEEALATLARPLVDPDSLAHPWAPLHLRFCRTMALGQLGRVGEALLVARDLTATAAREGTIGARFAGPADNVTAWVLRWSGRGDEAGELNQRAFEVTGGDAGPSADSLIEAHYVSLLDLADGAMLRGDLPAAAALAARLAPVDSWNGAMAWHQRHRLDLLRARLALADGDADAATALADRVAADAASRGADRYSQLARAVGALAEPSRPVEQVAPVIVALGRCAVLDGWPLVAALAASRGVDSWRDAAERMAAVVIRGCPEDDHAVAARRLADHVISGSR